jgi:hypothetical protein
MIKRDLEVKLRKLTKDFTNSVKKLAEEFALDIDVAVKLDINPIKEKGVKDGGS